MTDYAVSFGPIMARKHDMGTQVAAAVQQGAANFRCVRVTDGTDTAAQFEVPRTNFLFTAVYTGSLGNQIAAVLGTGSQAGTWRLTLALPGGTPEVYDNIGGTGAAFWQNLAAAVNDGQGPQRGPSLIVVANAGGYAGAPVAFTWTFVTGPAGTDGANVTARHSGGRGRGAADRACIALRGLGCSLALLADEDDATQWTDPGRFRIVRGDLHDPVPGRQATPSPTR